MTKAWYDIEMRGRRMEAIFKDCNTKYWKTNENEEMKESYFRRMMIIEKTIQPYIEQMTGVKKFLNSAKKEEKPNAQELYVSG